MSKYPESPLEVESLNTPRERTRLPYGAVPLMPWAVKYPGQTEKTYYEASLDHIEAVAHTALDKVLQSGLLPEHRFKLAEEFVVESLLDVHRRRIEINNRHHQLPVDTGPYKEIADAAIQGTATPNELLQLFLAFPDDIESIELAKLTHPFDISGDKDMRDDVIDSAVAAGFECMTDTRPHYKRKRVDHVLGAMVMVRKEAIGALKTDKGTVEIIERKGLLLLDGENFHLVSKHYVVDKGESEDGFYDIAAAAERRQQRGSLEDCDWLFPMTTSYYACYRK